MAAEITFEVRPAHLAAVGVEMAVAIPAVRDHDPRIRGADERVELLTVAVRGDHKERRIRGGRGPQRAALAAGSPACLIDMHRALIQHPVLQMQMRSGERLRSALADRVHTAGRERGAEQIARELRDPAARDTVPGGQRHDRRLQPRPKRGSADPVRQPRSSPQPAGRAAQVMCAVLGHDHADRRQLRDLVATEPAPGSLLVSGELATAPTTRLRVVIDDLIDLILGRELATSPPMPRLPTSPTPFSLRAHQLLRLRARLRPPLRTRLRRIRRRRPRTRPRVLTRRSLQTTQALLERLHTGSEIEHEPHTHFPTGVINRLRLRTIHACKIRCAKQESLPQSPTTERLRLFRPLLTWHDQPGQPRQGGGRWFEPSIVHRRLAGILC